MLVNPDLRYCHEICAKFWVAPTLLAAFVLPNLPRQIEPTHRQARGCGAGVPGGCGWGGAALRWGFEIFPRFWLLFVRESIYLLCDRVPNAVAVGLASQQGLRSRSLSGMCVHHSARNEVLACQHVNSGDNALHSSAHQSGSLRTTRKSHTPPHALALCTRCAPTNSENHSTRPKLQIPRDSSRKSISQSPKVNFTVP